MHVLPSAAAGGKCSACVGASVPLLFSASVTMSSICDHVSIYPYVELSLRHTTIKFKNKLKTTVVHYTNFPHFCHNASLNQHTGIIVRSLYSHDT